MLDYQSGQGSQVTEPFHDRSVIPCHSIRAWACVHTHPQAELWANSNLRDAGYTTFLPLGLVRRRDRALPTLWHEVKVPLFSRYLFIRFDHRSSSWSPIRAMPGVNDLLRNGSEVLYAPNSVIDGLKARVSERGIIDDPIDNPEIGKGIASGAAVAVNQGPLAGYGGTCRRWRPDRTWVMLNMLGGQCEVELPTDHVEVLRA